MAYPFSSLSRYHWQNNPFSSGNNQKPREREYDEDEENFLGIEGKTLLCFCAGILIICLICCARILHRVQDERSCSDERQSNSKVPRNHTCSSCSKVGTWLSTWLFSKNIFNETDKKCVQQPPDSTCHSGTTAAGCSHNQERWFPKLNQDVVRRRYSFNVDNDNSNIWAPLQKVKEKEPIPQGVRRRQSSAQEQRDPESYWFRDQPCEHWKGERNQQCLFQPVSPLPEKDTLLEEDI